MKIKFFCEENTIDNMNEVRISYYIELSKKEKENIEEHLSWKNGIDNTNDKKIIFYDDCKLLVKFKSFVRNNNNFDKIGKIDEFFELDVEDALDKMN